MRALRALGAGLLAAAVGVTGVGAAVAQESGESGVTDAQASTLESVAECLVTRNHLLVAFVIDESDSLAETDPDDARVDAALLALDNFTDLAATEIEGRAPLIEAHVAGFAHEFTPYAGWGDLADSDDQDEIRGALEDFADREDGLATDIPTALNEARQVIAGRAADVSGDEPCKVLLLFTDGRYALPFFEGSDESDLIYARNVDPTVPGAREEAERLGREFVCRSGGVADQLRDDGVVTLTAALSIDIAPTDQQFLEAMSTGRAGNETCGSDANPRYGAYLPADDAEDLVPVFNGIVEAVGGGTIGGAESVEGVCIGEPCEEGRQPFELEPALAEFSALLELRDPDVSVLVEGPDGSDAVEIVSDDDGAEELSGSRLEWRSVDEDTVRLTGALPADARDEWAGDWSFTFVAESEPDTARPPRTSLFYSTGWLPRLADAPQLVRGEATTVAVDVVDAAGAVVDPSDLGADVTLEATIVDPASGQSAPARVSGSDGSYEVEVASVGTSSAIALRARVRTTLESGRVLSPQSRVFELPVRAAALFPSLSPARLQLESVRGRGETSAELTVTGGADAGGCVWFETPVALRSAPVNEISADFRPNPTADDCLAVEAGQSRTVTVRFQNGESGEGVVRGTITATLLSRRTQATESFEIPFSFDLAPPINEAERFGLFLAILLPGVLAPIAFLALSNRRLARFRSTAGVQVARVPVLVERTLTQILRVFADGGAAGETALRVCGNEFDPIVLRTEDFTPVGKQKGTHVDAADLTFVARAPANPFGEVGATVEARSGYVAARVVGDTRSDESHLPLALPGTWAVALPSDGTPITGNGLDPSLPGGDARQWIRVDLVAFVAEGSLGSQLTALRGDLGSRLSDAANILADRVEGIDRTGGGRSSDWV